MLVPYLISNVQVECTDNTTLMRCIYKVIVGWDSNWHPVKIMFPHTKLQSIALGPYYSLLWQPIPSLHFLGTKKSFNFLNFNFWLAVGLLLCNNFMILFLFLFFTFSQYLFILTLYSFSLSSVQIVPLSLVSFP